jgi:hypothetical protein
LIPVTPVLNGKVNIDTEQLTSCFVTEIPRGDVRCSVMGEHRSNSTSRVYFTRMDCRMYLYHPSAVFTDMSISLQRSEIHELLCI